MSRATRLPLDEEPVRPTFNRERRAIKRGIFPVAGCDEVGRGPLAGPVVAAAVILGAWVLTAVYVIWANRSYDADVLRLRQRLDS